MIKLYQLEEQEAKLNNVFPANMYLFKVNNRNRGKYVKYV